MQSEVFFTHSLNLPAVPRLQSSETNSRLHMSNLKVFHFFVNIYHPIILLSTPLILVLIFLIIKETILVILFDDKRPIGMMNEKLVSN